MNQNNGFLSTVDTESVGHKILYRSDEFFRMNALSGQQREAYKAKLGKNFKDFTFNDYLGDVTSAMKTRTNKLIHNSVKKLFGTSDPKMFNFMSEQMRLNGMVSEDATDNEIATRLNSNGQFFEKVLNTVNPTLYLQPTRGLAYMTMPIVSYGLGAKTYELQSYTGNAIFTRIVDSKVTQNIQNIEVAGNSKKYDIKQYMIRNVLDYFTLQATTEAMKRANGSFNPFVGHIFSEELIKYLTLPQGYGLLLDNLTFLGQEQLDTPVETYTIVDGTGDNGIPLLTLTDIFGSSAPSDFLSMTVTQKIRLLGQIVGNVSFTSKGAKRATKMWIDLKSFVSMFGETNDYKDTDPLGYAYRQQLVDMIVPVAAWSDAYPDQTTIFVAESNTQTMHFNLVQPLSMAGVDIHELTIHQGFITQSTGTVVAQGIGATQFVCPFNAEAFGKVIVKSNDIRKRSEHTVDDLQVMPGLIKQLKGEILSRDRKIALPLKPTGRVMIPGIDDKGKQKSENNNIKDNK